MLLHLVASVEPAMPVDLHRHRQDVRLDAPLPRRDRRAARPDRRAHRAARPGGAHRRTTPIPACGCATPTNAARSARWRRWRARSPASTPGSPAASASRAARARELPLFEADGDRIKINPLADWTKDDVAAYRELPRSARASAGRRRLSLDRLHALHDARRRGRGRARRPLARPRQDRVRHPSRPRLLRDGRQRHMSASDGSDLAERRASSRTSGCASRPTRSCRAGD